MKKRRKKRKKIVRYDGGLYVGRIYPQARTCTGDLVEFRPRAPECWLPSEGQTLVADSYPELVEAFKEGGGEFDDGNPVLPDLGEGHWMLVKSLPPLPGEA